MEGLSAINSNRSSYHASMWICIHLNVHVRLLCATGLRSTTCFSVVLRRREGAPVRVGMSVRPRSVELSQETLSSPTVQFAW